MAIELTNPTIITLNPRKGKESYHGARIACVHRAMALRVIAIYGREHDSAV